MGRGRQPRALAIPKGDIPSRTGYHHPPETVARVLADILFGKRRDVAAKQYGVPVNTVHGWMWRMDRIIEPKNERGERIAALLEEYVESNLLTLKAQSELGRDREWLQKQSAGEIASFHTVLADRTIRILEAAQAAQLGAGAADGGRLLEASTPVR